jgi:tRNA(fMet)-specific endonuclease VapC
LKITSSDITNGELHKGVEKLADSKGKTSLREWLNSDLLLRFSGRVLTLDVHVMMTWGMVKAQQEKAGRSLPAIDSLIAALALYHNCVLATRNETDFASTNVPIINPWK